MDMKNDTAQIIRTMGVLAAFDSTGLSAMLVLLIAAAVVLKREF